MFRQISFIILSVVVSLYAVPLTSSVSPWEHSGDELTTSPMVIPGQAPIEYSSYFTREREMFGYKPRYMPGVVTFDKNNKPYILTGVHPTNEYDGNQSANVSSFETQIAYIQTIDDNGDWIVYDVAQMFRQLFNMGYYDTMRIYTGLARHDRVTFDYDNNVYFSYWQANGFSGKTIVYSKDGMQTVESLGLANNYMAMFEAFDTFASSERSLPTLSHTPTGLPVVLTELDRDIFGNLIFSKYVDVSTSQGMTSGGHTGYLNTTVTVGDTVHIVWLDGYDQTDEYYTRQYHSSYNRTTGEVRGPHYLGSTYGYWPEGALPADVHNAPTITVGKDKTLHVILGGHGSQSKYTYSTDGGKSWAETVDLPGDNSSSTYPSVITDREGTVHLVQRVTTGSYGLSYSRKKVGQNWEEVGALVVPYWTGYSLFNHKMTVDRLGRLFVNYWYKAANINPAAQAEYDAKWPSHEAELAHDPVILMSDDGGDSWKIATTADFVSGIIDDAIPVAVYNFDSANIGFDIADYDSSLDSIGSPTKISGVYGSGASFNGTTDGLIGNLNQAQAFEDGSFTVAGWFKPDATVSGLSNLVNAKTGTNGFALSVNSGQWIGYTYADGYTHSVVASSDTTVGQWKHIAFTYKADGEADETGTYTGTSKLYVDGVLVATQTGRKYSPQGASDVAIAMDTAQANFFACSADELGIFKGAMPEQRIVELADNTFRPQNVSRELISPVDFNQDGIVDIDDLMVITDNWLATE